MKTDFGESQRAPGRTTVSRHRRRGTKRGPTGRRLGIIRSRMSQVTSLLNLAPSIQEVILTGEQVSERKLREASGLASWSEQREVPLR